MVIGHLGVLHAGQMCTETKESCPVTYWSRKMKSRAWDTSWEQGWDPPWAARSCGDRWRYGWPELQPGCLLHLFQVNTNTHRKGG